MINYLSQAEAGRRLGVSRQRVLALIKAGKLKANIIGGRRLISVRELERLASLRRKDGRG
jgi:excisionase family DNA binding protein